MALDDIWGWLTNRPGSALSQMLTTNGEPDGNADANGNYSVTPQDFWFAPPIGVIYETLALNVFLTTMPVPDQDHYGQIIAGLTNGIQFILKRGSYEKIVSPIGAIKSNGELIQAGAHLDDTGLNGGTTLHVYRFGFLQNFARSLSLHGDLDESFRVRCRDNLTGLTLHRFSVNGIRRAITRDQQL